MSVWSLMSGARAAMVVAASVLIGACGDNPVDPTAQLQISCPASKSVESLSGESVVVDFGTPSTSGGTAPVSVTCTPPSGSKFSVGPPTAVQCTARDAKQQAASCGLNVAVTRVGTLSATRFMAFGDSITFGPLLTPCPVSSGRATTHEAILRDMQLLFERANPRETPPATSYPAVLRTLLANRYVTQSPVVVNEGLGGEFVTDGGGTNDATLARLRARLTANSPGVVLLQEGINDIDIYFFHHVERIPQLIKGLRDMVGVVRGRGARVLLGTLLPADPNGCRGSQGYDLVAPANDQIRAMAASEGVAVVDLYQAFGGVPGPYLNDDGLHPNPLGYQKMAETFFDVIRKTLEVPR
jgi:lysophospholipase L1-like esterase